MKSKKKRNSGRPAPARWMPDPATPMFVTCSCCGFRIETLRAVETGWTATEHVALKYKHCPECGRPMRLSDGTAGDGAS